MEWGLQDFKLLLKLWFLQSLHQESLFRLFFSRAIGETMIVAIAAGQQPRLTMNLLVPVETITAYIIQVCLGDVPHGSLEYKTIFAAGITLFVIFSF